MDTVKIGKFLSDLRHEKNLTQEQLGEILGITNKTISRWENGTYMPKVEMLQELSIYYEISINEILSGEKLTDLEYKKGAEKNIIDTLENDESNRKRIEKIFFGFSIAIVITYAIIVFLVSRINIDTFNIERFAIIVATLVLAFLSSTCNLALYLLQKIKI